MSGAGRPAAAGSFPPSLGSLSTGVVFVRVSPVRDDAEAAELTHVLRRIHGVSTVDVGGSDGASALFRVVLARPVAMGSDLRDVFGRGLRSFTRVADGFEVVLNVPQQAPAAAPPPPDGRRPAWPGFPDGSEPDLPFVARHAPRPTAPPPAPGPWGVPTPGPHVEDPGAEPADGDLEHLVFGGTDPGTVAGAFAAERDLSVFIVDATTAVRAVFGGLHTRSVRLSGPLVGRTVDEVAPPHEYPGLAERVAAALAGRPGSLEAHSASSDRIYRVTVTPIVDGPQVKGALVVARDVAEQLRDRRLLAEMTGVFEIAFEGSPAGQALLSPSGRWLRLNGALERLLGRDAESLVGTPMRDVTHPDDAAADDELRASVLRRTRDEYGLDLRLVRGDSARVAVRCEMTAIRDDEGGVRGFLAHVVDAGVWAASASRREKPREPRHAAPDQG